MAISEAMGSVQNQKTAYLLICRMPIIKERQESGSWLDYKYAHDYPNHYVKQQYLPEEIKGSVFYHPGDLGKEKEIKEWLQYIRT